MKRRHLIILCLSLILLLMNTSCFRKEEKRIEAQWENTLLLPGCAGMPENVGLAGAYSGIVEGKLLVLGGESGQVGGRILRPADRILRPVPGGSGQLQPSCKGVAQ